MVVEGRVDEIKSVGTERAYITISVGIGVGGGFVTFPIAKVDVRDYKIGDNLRVTVEPA